MRSALSSIKSLQVWDIISEMHMCTPLISLSQQNTYLLISLVLHTNLNTSFNRVVLNTLQPNWLYPNQAKLALSKPNLYFKDPGLRGWPNNFLVNLILTLV